MAIRFGYACLNTTLGVEGGFRSMIKKTWLEKGIDHASRIGLENSRRLCGIISWNNRYGIRVYRMSSTMFPWASEYSYEDLPDWAEIRSNLESAAKIAAKGNQRLSFHPGQFNCLTSANEKVVTNCLRDLEIHGQLMDVMGQPRTPGAKINIHLGGSFGNKDASIDQWCRNFERIPESVRTRLTLENDDKASCFSVVDLKRVSDRTGCPIVFDAHHFEVGPKGELNYEDSIRMAASTWPDGIRPVCHLSNSAKVFEKKPVSITAHSDYIYKPFNDCGLDLDVVIEAKAKEIAVIHYIRKFGHTHGVKNVESLASLNTDLDIILTAK